MIGPRIYWIDTDLPGRLAVMPRPMGGPDLAADLKAIRGEGADLVVSLLGRYEIELLSLENEGPCCEECSMRFLSLPIEDRGLPTEAGPVHQLAQQLLTDLQQGKRVVVHCRMGIGRSSLLAACVLVLSGMGTEESFARIELARGCPVPDTREQRVWVADFERSVRA